MWGRELLFDFESWLPSAANNTTHSHFSGLRVTLYPFYPQLDTASTFIWGTAVFTRGLSDQTGSDWKHMYYRVQYNGVGSYSGSNGVDNGRVVYIRPLYTQVRLEGIYGGGGGGVCVSVCCCIFHHSFTIYSPLPQMKWVYAGALSQYDTIRSTYPDAQYELGVDYNGDVKQAFANGWNVYVFELDVVVEVVLLSSFEVIQCHTHTYIYTHTHTF